jgi:hypothetical protein
MIKDIGTEGLRCPYLHPETIDSIRRFNKAMIRTKKMALYMGALLDRRPTLLVRQAELMQSESTGPR